MEKSSNLNNLLKEVLLASGQYQHNPTPAQLCYLSKQLEALRSECTSPCAVQQLENNDNLGLIECLTFFVDVLRNRESALDLIRPVLKTLRILAQARSIQQLLYETLNVCPILAGQVITLSSLTEEQQTLLEALKLLQKLTYGRRVNYHQQHMENLVKFLNDSILDGSDELISPVLGTLANLCRQNVLVQSAIKNMNHGSLKKLQKRLCTYLIHDNHMLVISSLSVYYSLSVSENEDGQKAFFEKSNVEHTLETIFQIIVYGSNSKTLAWKYAADLLADMLRHQQMQVCVKQYRHLPKCMASVLSLLSGSEEFVTELFPVLLKLCCAPAVRQAVNTVLFAPLSQANVSKQALMDTVQSKCQHGLAEGTEPIVSCLYWIAGTPSNKGGSKGAASCAALDFLAESCQDCLCDNDSNIPLKNLIPAVSSLLSHREHTEIAGKVKRLVKLLSVLCYDKESCEVAGRHLELTVISDLLEKQLSTSYISYAAVSSSLLANQDSKGKQHCILNILDLGVKLRKFVPGMLEHLVKLLQDSRLHDVVALGLCSNDQEEVEIALRLLFISKRVEECHPDVLLCSSVACLNRSRGKPATHHQQDGLDYSSVSMGQATGGMWYNSLHNKENHQPLYCSTPIPNVKGKLSNNHLLNQTAGKEQPQQSVESLIETMQSALEPKDSKSAEVIEIFEHQIKVLEVNREHLNNLLDAKTLALVQADRVISQLRSREAVHATEMKKFQSILKKSENRNDQLLSQLNAVRVQSDEQKSNLDAQLDKKDQEIQAIKDKFSELTERYGDLEDKNSVLKQEKKYLSDLLANLQNELEQLKEQYTISCDQSKQLEEERKTLSKCLKDKDVVLQKNQSTLQALQTKYAVVQKEKVELEKEKEDIEAYVDKLRDQLGTSENSCRLLQQKTTTLEGVNEEQGLRLVQQTKRIADVEAELAKHNQIFSFINQMNLNTEQQGAKK